MLPIVKEAPSQPPRFLRLPPEVRRRILFHTGLARFDGHPYTYYLDGRKESRRVVQDLDPPPTSNFAGLLRSCTTLYAEAAALLYSANRFVIFFSHEGSLAPLRALTSTAVSSLTNLKIVLNQTACHQHIDSANYPPYCCCDGRDNEPKPWPTRYLCAESHGGMHDSRPLFDLAWDMAEDLGLITPKKATWAMLSEWHDSAVYLSSRVAPGRLELSLVCDVAEEHQEAYEAARLAVAPISLFPRLKNCHVRLSEICTRPLQRLAEEAVLQACGTAFPSRLQPGVRRSSALMDLPPELRLRILGYTDLITPWKEVTWSRQNLGYQVCRPPCERCPPDVHHGCRLSRCDPRVFYLWHRQEPTAFPGCFCRRRHAAFSLSCNCWVPPTNLFLVCRTLCRDAQFVFFSGNRFSSFPAQVLTPRIGSPPRWSPAKAGLMDKHPMADMNMIAPVTDFRLTNYMSRYCIKLKNTSQSRKYN